MITVISAALGFMGSMIPDILAIFRDNSDKKHELKIMNLQIEQQKQGHNQRLEEINIQADITETNAIYKTYASGINWVDALNASVRPVLAYAFFLLYALMKWINFVILGMDIDAASTTLWGEEDQAIFAGIISFYFGQRAFRKLRK